MADRRYYTAQGFPQLASVTLPSGGGMDSGPDLFGGGGASSAQSLPAPDYPSAYVGPTNEFGTQPVDQWGFPINPGFGAPSNLQYPSGGLQYPPPTDYIPPSSPGSPSVGGQDISGFGGVPSGQFLGPTLGQNTYDAGNGVTYVYDANWNYLYTMTTPGTTGPTQTASGSAGYNPFNGAQAGASVSPPTATMPWYAGAGPYPGGNTNPANPGYVAPRATTSDVYTPGQSGWEGTGGSFWSMVPGGVSAKNI